MAPKGFYLGPVSRQCLDGSTRGSKGPQITAGLGEVWCVREQLHSHFVYLSDTTRTRVLTLGEAAGLPVEPTHPHPRGEVRVPSMRWNLSRCLVHSFLRNSSTPEQIPKGRPLLAGGALEDRNN